jgi:predicted TIM-barrel fold metal-dependent hydrolase
VHVFGPADRYPFAASRTYKPGDASVEDLQAHQAALRLDRVVIVQPSPYGADNACTVDGLLRLGDQSRGVAVIDPATTEAELWRMHAAGVRGVRVNLETSSQSDPAIAAAELRGAAARVAPLGWHVQVFTNLGVVQALHDMLLTLPVTVVLDHFAGAKAALSTGQPGFGSLLSLVRQGRAYVKLSAPQRSSALENVTDVLPLARALAEANPERLVWGSDWPHPGAWPNRPRHPDELESFHPIDDGHALNRLASWFPEAGLRRLILSENPARLYDFPPA